MSVIVVLEVSVNHTGCLVTKRCTAYGRRGLFVQLVVHLLINLSEPFSTRPSDRAQIWHACVERDETGSHQKKLTNPTPEGFRGLFIDVGGMFVGLWVCGWYDSSR